MSHQNDLSSHPAAGVTTSRAGRLSLVAALYSTQNLSLGFFTFAFLTIAQGRGVSLAAIGGAAGVATVLTLKFLWAPVVDRYGSRRLGHYRGWLIVTQSTLGLGIASLALFDPAEDFSALLVVFAALFVVAATQDIAADAAATRILGPADRGIGNGFQSAGSCVAQVVGGGVTLIVYQAAGWQVTALALGAFSLVAMPFVLAWREDADSADQPAPRVTLRSALAFFADRNVRLWCLVAMPAYTIGFTIAYNLVRPILVDAGWAEARIGLVVVIGGSGVGIVAGIAAGMAIARLGRRRALVRLGVLQVLATLATVPIALGATGLWVVLLVVAVANGAFAASAAVVFTLSMDLTRPESAGTDFTFFSTVSGIAMVASAALGLAAADAFGFGPVVAGAAVLAALGLILAVRTVDRIDVEPRQEVAVPVVASS